MIQSKGTGVPLGQDSTPNRELSHKARYKPVKCNTHTITKHNDNDELNAFGQKTTKILPGITMLQTCHNT